MKSIEELPGIHWRGVPATLRGIDVTTGNLSLLTKVCPCCGEELPLGAFYLLSGETDKVRNQCISCYKVFKGRNNFEVVEYAELPGL